VKKTILLVDDDRLIRRAIARFLKLGGWNVIEAENEHDAARIIEGIDSQIPDVVLTDLDLRSGGSGLHVVGAAQVNGIPVALMSGDFVGGRPAGVLCFDKPLEISAVTRQLDELMMGAR